MAVSTPPITRQPQHQAIYQAQTVISNPLSSHSSSTAPPILPSPADLLAALSLAPPAGSINNDRTRLPAHAGPPPSPFVHQVDGGKRASSSAAEWSSPSTQPLGLPGHPRSGASMASAVTAVTPGDALVPAGLPAADRQSGARPRASPGTGTTSLGSDGRDRRGIASAGNPSASSSSSAGARGLHVSIPTSASPAGDLYSPSASNPHRGRQSPRSSAPSSSSPRPTAHSAQSPRERQAAVLAGGNQDVVRGYEQGRVNRAPSGQMRGGTTPGDDKGVPSLSQHYHSSSAASRRGSGSPSHRHGRSEAAFASQASTALLSTGSRQPAASPVPPASSASPSGRTHAVHLQCGSPHESLQASAVPSGQQSSGCDDAILRSTRGSHGQSLMTGSGGNYSGHSTLPDGESAVILRGERTRSTFPSMPRRSQG